MRKPAVDSFKVTCEVGLRSTVPLRELFDFETVGGFSVIVQDRPILFDWTSAQSNVSWHDDGTLQIDWYLKEFDEEYFKDSNELVNKIDWKDIISGELEEVYYENGYIQDGIETFVPMRLIYVKFTVYDERSMEVKTYSFSEEKIKKCNELQLKEI